MKKIFFFIAISFVSLASCRKDAASTAVLNETVDTTAVMPKGMGSFMNGPYGSVSGKATVFSQNGTFTLQLENMNISNGPDLHVYISQEQQPVNFIDLGKLKSTMGNQVYSIPGMPDFNEYKYTLVHCQQYNHLFGSAILQ
jgi:hypothetical protein